MVCFLTRRGNSADDLRNHAGAEGTVRNEKDQLPVLQRASLHSDTGEVVNK